MFNRLFRGSDGQKSAKLDVSSFIEILNYRECSMFWVSHESVVNTHIQMQIRNVNNPGSEMLVMGCEQEQVKLISHLSRNKNISSILEKQDIHLNHSLSETPHHHHHGIY